MGVIPWEQFGTCEVVYFGVCPWKRGVWDYVAVIDMPDALLVALG